MSTTRDAYREDAIATFENEDGAALVIESDGRDPEFPFLSLNAYDEGGQLIVHITDDDEQWAEFVAKMSPQGDRPEPAPAPVIAEPDETVYVVHSGGGTLYVATTDELTAYRTAARTWQEYGYAVIEGYRDGVLVELA